MSLVTLHSRALSGRDRQWNENKENGGTEKVATVYAFQLSRSPDGCRGSRREKPLMKVPGEINDSLPCEIPA